MDPTAERHETLWILPASPAIWAAHFLLCYITVAIWCGMIATPQGSLGFARVAIAIYTVMALAGISAIGYVGFRRHRFVGEPPPHDADSPEDRFRFIGFSTLLLSGLSALAVCYAALTIVFIEACQ